MKTAIVLLMAIAMIISLGGCTDAGQADEPHVNKTPPYPAADKTGAMDADWEPTITTGKGEHP